MTWNRNEIRQARRTPLEPIIQRPGYELAEKPDGNRLVVGLSSEVLIKEHYWVRTEDGAVGNAIDFLMTIEGLNFAEAMRRIRS